eukprot:GILK01003737.1.p1 GENE.GILK01003737.1~~GILK01003737.1.p1  ORF type:complete len:1180 (-),score=363.78 GILK01003737.1:22-3561(-)
MHTADPATTEPDTSPNSWARERSSSDSEEDSKYDRDAYEEDDRNDGEENGVGDAESEDQDDYDMKGQVWKSELNTLTHKVEAEVVKRKMPGGRPVSARSLLGTPLFAEGRASTGSIRPGKIRPASASLRKRAPSPTEDRPYPPQQNPLFISSSHKLAIYRNLKTHPTARKPENEGNQTHRLKAGKDVKAATGSSIQYDKETLYEELLKHKKLSNAYKEENMKLKTQMQIVEKEMVRRERTIDELLSRNVVGAPPRYNKIREEGHLLATLKKQVKELRKSIQDKDEVISKMKRDTRLTRIQELESEARCYLEESLRLKKQLDDRITREKEFERLRQATGLESNEESPVDLRGLEDKFMHQLAVIRRLKQEQTDMREVCKRAQEETRKWCEVAQETEKKLKQVSGKEQQKDKQKDKEVQKLRTALETAQKELKAKTATEMQLKEKLDKLTENQQKSEKVKPKGHSEEEVSRVQQQLTQKAQVAEQLRAQLEERDALVRALHRTIEELRNRSNGSVVSSAAPVVTVVASPRGPVVAAAPPVAEAERQSEQTPLTRPSEEVAASLCAIFRRVRSRKVNLQEQFTAQDTRATGKVAVAAFIKIMEDLIPELIRAKLMQVVAHYDSTRSGSLKYSDLIQSLDQFGVPSAEYVFQNFVNLLNDEVNQKQLQGEQLWSNLFGVELSQGVTMVDFAKGAVCIDCDLTIEEASALFRRLNLNCSGRLTLNEVAKFVPALSRQLAAAEVEKQQAAEQREKAKQVEMAQTKEREAEAERAKAKEREAEAERAKAQEKERQAEAARAKQRQEEEERAREKERQRQREREEAEAAQRAREKEAETAKAAKLLAPTPATAHEDDYGDSVYEDDNESGDEVSFEQMEQRSTSSKRPTSARPTSAAPQRSTVSNVTASEESFQRAVSTEFLLHLYKVAKEKGIRLTDRFKDGGSSGDGTINAEEFSQMILSIDPQISSEHLRQLFKSFDDKGKGVISYKRFVKGVKSAAKADKKTKQARKDKPEPLPAPQNSEQQLLEISEKIFNKTQRLREMFGGYDRNGSGVIDVDSFLHCIHNLNESFSADDVNQILNMAELDETKQIDYYLFLHRFNRRPQSASSTSATAREREKEKEKEKDDSEKQKQKKKKKESKKEVKSTKKETQDDEDEEEDNEEEDEDDEHEEAEEEEEEEEAETEI